MENFIFCAVPYPFIFGKNRKHSKEIYDCFEQGKMVIEQSDHNYCKIFPRIIKYRGRYSVQDSKRWRRMEMKSQYIPKDLQIQRKAGDRSFFFANLTPITHFYFIETGPLKPRERERDVFEISWTNKKRFAFPSFCLMGQVLKTIQLDLARLIVEAPVRQRQSWYP